MTSAELDDLLSPYLREVLYIAAVVFFSLGYDSEPRNIMHLIFRMDRRVS